MLEEVIKKFNIEQSWVDTSSTENIKSVIKPNTKLIFIETPTNPMMLLSDIKAICNLAHKHDILVAVDNTFMSPYFQRPIELGADFIVHSTTKYLNGHSDVIGGIIIVNDVEYGEKLHFIQMSVGAVPGPFDCWLTLLGVKTLHLRMHRHASNAQAVAEFLESHPQVEKITYPGLKSHPQYGVAKEQMDGFSGMISFELKGGIPAGTTVMNNVKLCSLAESLGAVETMITHPASMTHVDVPAEERHARGLTDGLVRISVGIEDPEDIIDDLKQALEKV